MKARLPQGMSGGGAANLQQLARQAQKMQEQMEQITTERRNTPRPQAAEPFPQP